MSNAPESQENPQQEQKPAPRRVAHDKKRQRSVVFYIAILFSAAFLLLALSFAMERRQNAQDMDELNQSITGLKDSVSAMQSVQKLYEENAALKEQVSQLEKQLGETEQERDYLSGKLSSLDSEKSVLQRSIQALDWFWQIDEAYVRGRYTTCRELIAKLEENDLQNNLPRVSITDNGRFSPYDRYREIRDAVL